MSINSKFISPFTPNTDQDKKKMLDAIGVRDVEELFLDIPVEQRNPTLNLPAPTSELELRREIEEMASQNYTPGEYSCFLGAGSYRHFVPAVVRQIASRSEFMTSYTPYQPEISQGTLQAHYEFQSLVCQLTGMEVANSGMYDGSTSLAEAALMAVRITKRNRISILDSVSPFQKQVIDTYIEAPGIEIDSVNSTIESIHEDTACLIVQQPNFFGYIEDLDRLSKIAHENGALLVVSCDPLSLAMFKSPSEYDADIVVSEGQTLGISPTFGGPYVGFFSCKKKYIRQMPGRIVGKTTDTNGTT